MSARARLFLPVLLALAGCRQRRAPRRSIAPASAASARARPTDPLTARLSASIASAQAAAQRLRAARPDWAATASHSACLPAYLALRRATAAIAPFSRDLGVLGSEVLFGPPRASEEVAGALLALDRAVADGDQVEAARQLGRVDQGLLLLARELELNGLRVPALLRDLSAAAYEVGLAAVEAEAQVPEGHDAALADVQGLTDGIALVVDALGGGAGQAGRAQSLARAIAHGAEHGFDRADLVIRSGALGVALRRFAAELGVAVSPPYRARYPVAGNDADEPVSAFTLPAPRVDLRPGDARALAELGEKLFFDRLLSRGDRRSCADCHQPARAYQDGLRVPASLDPKAPLLRNTPTLLYAPLQAAQLWDGQLAGAEGQALKVIHARAELGLTDRELQDKLTAAARYQDALSALPGGPSAANVARALVAFESRLLVPGRAPIDRFARGEPGGLDEAMKRGFELFAGKGRCARCHVPPLFGGSRPPDFSTPIFAVLGVVAAPGGKQLDADPGRGAVTGRARDQGAFKVPTVRDVDRTAPYFHHGRFATLESVIDFYDQGGGRGAGLPVPNQDPEVRKLSLTAAERAALADFLRRALGDD